jgi:hypothetical protein
MRKKVKSIAGIKACGMNLQLRINKRSDKFKICNKFGKSRLLFDKFNNNNNNNNNNHSDNTRAMRREAKLVLLNQHKINFILALLR